MKTIELSTGTLLVVNARDYFTDRAGTDIPAYFDYLGHPSEITGEVWGKVVDSVAFVDDNGHTYSEYYRDYTNLQQIVSSEYDVATPLQSGLSLCAAHGIKETDVLLFKSKNS